MAWQTQSPDLSIMESVWDYMKRKMQLRQHKSAEKNVANSLRRLEQPNLERTLRKMGRGSAFDIVTFFIRSYCFTVQFISG